MIVVPLLLLSLGSEWGEYEKEKDDDDDGDKGEQNGDDEDRGEYKEEESGLRISKRGERSTMWMYSLLGILGGLSLTQLVFDE